jgi:hypothetical protein
MCGWDGSDYLCFFEDFDKDIVLIPPGTDYWFYFGMFVRKF